MTPQYQKTNQDLQIKTLFNPSRRMAEMGSRKSRSRSNMHPHKPNENTPEAIQKVESELPRSKSLADFLTSLRNQINESQKQHQNMISQILK